MQEDSGKIEAAEAASFDMPSGAALKRLAGEMDFNKVIAIDAVEDLGQFYALVNKPPLHSVVMRFAPAVAKYLLEKTNSHNRPKQRAYHALTAAVMRDGEWGITGDTVKFSKTGVLLDGQHRLSGSATSQKALTTHVVFGLEDDVFDILDQGKKRSPGDILALCGVSNYNTVAGAVARVRLIEEGKKGNATWALTPRKICELAIGPMKAIQQYTADGLLVHKAYKHPPSMITAILYLIGQHSRAVAKDFAHEWVHGARVGRNKNFDVLSERLLTVARTGGGHINNVVRSAMIIQCFNYWNAGIVASAIGLKYDKKWVFPRLVFDKAAFRRSHEKGEIDDTSLLALQERMLGVLGHATDKDGNVEVPVPELAKRSYIPANQISYVLSTMEDEDLIHCSRRRGASGPAIWRLRDAGLAKLREEAGVEGELASA